MPDLIIQVDSFDQRKLAVKRTVFVIDGVAYEIDTCEASLAQWQADTRRYVAAARKLGAATVTVNGEAVKSHTIRSAVPFIPATEPGAATNGREHHPTSEPTSTTTSTRRPAPKPLTRQPATRTSEPTRPKPEPATSGPTRASKPALFSEPTRTTEPIRTSEPPRAKPAPHLPPVAELPPDRAWLKPGAHGNERTGAGSSERQKRGRKYRTDMRVWLRGEGFTIGVKGHVPDPWADLYWQACVAARAAESG